jgi:hypothetical protein
MVNYQDVDSALLPYRVLDLTEGDACWVGVCWVMLEPI